MGYDTIKVETRDGITVVTVSRPDKLNALNEQVIDELTKAFLAVRDDASVRAAILTGAGEKAFIAGADIAVLATCGPVAARENSLKGQALTLLLENLGKPVIAAINGFALGGGCEMAMACTLRVAVEGAKFGQPEVKLGLICGYGGTQRLPQLVGRGRALELLLTGDMIDAAEAHRIGLVNKVVKKETLLADCEAIAKKIAAVGPVAVKFTLDAVGAGSLDAEATYFGLCFATQDMKEGTAAFLEKRPAKFQGR